MTTFTLNGQIRTASSEPMARLLDVLREEFRLIGTKEGCGEGECGSCTILLDDEPVNACLVALGQVEGRKIVTIEGLGSPAHLDPIGKCFVEHGGAQCGICTPGMVVSVHHLLRSNRSPSEEDIREAIAGNLCRCTGYQRIVESVLRAAEMLREEEKKQQ